MTGNDVLVGIPEEDNRRKAGDIGNAQLLFIHTNGSPLRNIPARPVIEPAIMAHKDEISIEMKQAAVAFLTGNQTKGVMFLKRAGMIGQNVSRGWFTDSRNGWPPNADSTVREKLNKLKGKKLKDALAVLDSGGSMEGVNTPLIDTGAMRKAITYVIRTC